MCSGFEDLSMIFSSGLLTAGFETAKCFLGAGSNANFDFGGSMNCACATRGIAITGAVAARTDGAAGCVWIAGAGGFGLGENDRVETGLFAGFD